MIINSFVSVNVCDFVWAFLLVPLRCVSYSLCAIILYEFMNLCANVDECVVYFETVSGANSSACCAVCQYHSKE